MSSVDSWIRLNHNFYLNCRDSKNKKRNRWFLILHQVFKEHHTIRRDFNRKVLSKINVGNKQSAKFRKSFSWDALTLTPASPPPSLITAVPHLTLPAETKPYCLLMSRLFFCLVLPHIFLCLNTLPYLSYLGTRVQYICMMIKAVVKIHHERILR